MGSGLTPEQRQKVEEIRLKAQRTMRREGDDDRAFLLSLVEELDRQLQEREQWIKQHADALTRWLGGGRILARWLVNMPTVEDLGRAKESLRAIELPGERAVQMDDSQQRGMDTDDASSAPDSRP